MQSCCMTSEDLEYKRKVFSPSNSLEFNIPSSGRCTADIYFIHEMIWWEGFEWIIGLKFCWCVCVRSMCLPRVKSCSLLRRVEVVLSVCCFRLFSPYWLQDPSVCECAEVNLRADLCVLHSAVSVHTYVWFTCASRCLQTSDSIWTICALQKCILKRICIWYLL